MPHDFDDDFPELTDEQAIAREEEMKSRQEFREWRKKYLELPADEQKWLSEQPKLVQDYYYAMPLKERGRKIRDEMRYERREKEVSEFLRSKIAPTKIAPTKENPSSETDLRTDLEDLDFAIDKFAFETTWAQPELKDTSMANLHWLAPEWQHQLRQWGNVRMLLGTLLRGRRAKGFGIGQKKLSNHTGESIDTPTRLSPRFSSRWVEKSSTRRKVDQYLPFFRLITSASSLHPAQRKKLGLIASRRSSIGSEHSKQTP